MSEVEKLPKTRLLIYIPCHKDFDMAFANSKKIINQILKLEDGKLDVEILISINGVESIPDPGDLPFTTINHIQSVLGADANIAKGFISALEIRPDYFWILSANENLVENAMKNISSVIEDHPEADLIVTNAAGRNGRLEIDNIFLDLPPLLALGLISGVIYKFGPTKSFYSQSTMFSWTGWGHLAVIQNYLSTAPAGYCREIPDNFLYEKPYTYTPEAVGGQSEREIVKNLYAHSFYGLPVLAYCLWRDKSSLLERFQAEWLKANWYKLNFFSKQATIGDELKLQRSGWIRAINQQTFKTSFPIRTIYFLGSKIPSERFQNSGTAVKLLSFYKRVL
jgi:hypothetical protein